MACFHASRIGSDNDSSGATPSIAPESSSRRSTASTRGFTDSSRGCALNTCRPLRSKGLRGMSSSDSSIGAHAMTIPCLPSRNAGFGWCLLGRRPKSDSALLETSSGTRCTDGKASARLAVVSPRRSPRAILGSSAPPIAGSPVSKRPELVYRLSTVSTMGRARTPPRFGRAYAGLQCRSAWSSPRAAAHSAASRPSRLRPATSSSRASSQAGSSSRSSAKPRDSAIRASR